MVADRNTDLHIEWQQSVNVSEHGICYLVLTDRWAKVVLREIGSMTAPVTGS